MGARSKSFYSPFMDRQVQSFWLDEAMRCSHELHLVAISLLAFLSLLPDILCPSLLIPGIVLLNKTAAPKPVSGLFFLMEQKVLNSGTGFCLFWLLEFRANLLMSANAKTNGYRQNFVELDNFHFPDSRITFKR